MASIILLGIKHCGKSTQGKLLSKHFKCDFFDTDDEVTKSTGKTPREIYSELGKDAFLAAEKDVCAKLALDFVASAGSADINPVIATGGGICNNQPALDELHKTGIFVFLNADEDTACNRIIREIEYDDDGKTMKNLPAYIAKENPADISDVRKIFHSFYVERVKLYKSICDIEVKLEHSASKQQNLKTILEAVKH